MPEEYLWDGSGEPDPDIQNLERILSVYRDTGAPIRRANHFWPALLAIAASIVVGIVVWRAYQSDRSEWRIEGATPQRLHSGQTIETAGTALRLESEETGQVTVEPRSRLVVLRSRRLALQQGAMHALIWAPPAQFQVETPSATAIDLGCEYTLNVSADGSGLLTVQMGWVAFQSGENESFIPFGAACRTRKVSGPGLPYFTDASAAFIAAVENGDIGGMLADSRPRDALTLWHLLLRSKGTDRQRVARRFADIVPGVDAARLSRCDSAAIESAWNSLGLGETEWWRSWKRNW